jgi:cytochrome P450
MTTTETAGLPVYPGTRSPACPFDPPAEYRDWVRADGLQRVRLRNGAAAWAVSRYEDVKAVLADPRISADGRRFPADLMPQMRQQVPVFPRLDDPEHARQRRMLTGYFTVRRVATMRPEIEKVVADQLDQMIADGQPADLVRAYALPVPSLVISVLLGVPYADHDFFQRHSATMNRMEATPEAKTAASRALHGYLLGLLDRKEREPADDLLTHLLTERVDTGEITRELAAMFGLTLLFAGHETTANMIGLSTLALLRHPEQAARLRDADDPAEIATAIEELLRHLSIAQDLIYRVATEDIVIGGQLVRAGEGLTINFPAANRDPAFLTDADVLSLARNPRGHLAFGHGVHQCLGQQLARMELQVALPALLRRLPGLRLAIPFEDVKFRHDMSAYGVHELPVAW